MATVIQSIAPATPESSSSGGLVLAVVVRAAKRVSASLERQMHLVEAAIALLPRNTDSDQSEAVLRALLREILDASNELDDIVQGEQA